MTLLELTRTHAEVLSKESLSTYTVPYCMESHEKQIILEYGDLIHLWNPFPGNFFSKRG